MSQELAVPGQHSSETFRRRRAVGNQPGSGEAEQNAEQPRGAQVERELAASLRVSEPEQSLLLSWEALVAITSWVWSMSLS